MGKFRSKAPRRQQLSRPDRLAEALSKMTVENGCTKAESAVAAAKLCALTVKRSDDDPIASIEKNSEHTLLIRLRSFKGYELVDLRLFFQAIGGELRPTKEGFALRIALLPALLAGVQAAHDEAVRRGLLPKDHPRRERG